VSAVAGMHTSKSSVARGIVSGIEGSAVIWQYAQSPRRAQFSAGCPANQAADGNCYAPGVAPGSNTFVDLNTADSAESVRSAIKRSMFGPALLRKNPAHPPSSNGTTAAQTPQTIEERESGHGTACEQAGGHARNQ